MRRRALIATTLATALATPAGAQVGERPRRIGVLLDLPGGTERGQTRLAAFLQGLQESGWSVGRNLRIDYRWRETDPAQIDVNARELVALAPDVILGSSTPVVAALVQQTRSIPIVFVLVTDPVGAGFVDSIARPGGNVTGFTTFDTDIGAKWVEVLNDVSPELRRIAFVNDAGLVTTPAQRATLRAAAARLGVDVTEIDVRDPAAMETALAVFAHEPGGGLVVGTNPLTGFHRDRIIAAAARLRIPAVYPYDHFALAGGLIAYGPSTVDPYRRAAGYVDRILRGAKPSDLPVQSPSKLEIIVNQRTAKMLGVTIPRSLLLPADEVIE